LSNREQRRAIREGQIAGLAIVSIALVATRAVPADAHLPWLIYNASGSAQLAFHGSKIALRPVAIWWSSGHP